MKDKSMIIINNRDKIQWKKGITIQDILDKMGYDFAMITVTVNDELVVEVNYNSYQLNDNDKVGIFHLAHGG